MLRGPKPLMSLIALLLSQPIPSTSGNIAQTCAHLSISTYPIPTGSCTAISRLDNGLLLALTPQLPPWLPESTLIQWLAQSLKMYHSLITLLLGIPHCLPTHSNLKQNLLQSSRDHPLHLTLPTWPLFPLLILLQEIDSLEFFEYSKLSPTPSFFSRCSLCPDSSAQMSPSLTHLYPKHGSPFNINI